MTALSLACSSFDRPLDSRYTPCQRLALFSLGWPAFRPQCMMMTLDDLTRAMHEFVASKGWYAPDSPKPQTPKNIACSLAIEAAEVLEHFQWTDDRDGLEALSGELADVALYLLQLASVSGINLEQAIVDKLEINASRTWPEPTRHAARPRADEASSQSGAKGPMQPE